MLCAQYIIRVGTPCAFSACKAIAREMEADVGFAMLDERRGRDA